MFFTLIAKFHATAKALFAGQVVNNQLNPSLLVIATTGYRIQSRMLRIPDRFGFFSPGPSRLQVSQASTFVGMVVAFCILTVWSAFTLYLLILQGVPNVGKVAMIMVAMTVAEVAFIWLTTCRDYRRAPDYDWGEWKLRKD